MKRIIILLFCFMHILNAYVVTAHAILKGIETSNNMQFYNPSTGYINCPTYGVISPDSLSLKSCKISKKRFKMMQWYSRGFMNRVIYREQKYKIDYINGYCIIKNGSKIYNEQLIVAGYAITSFRSIDEEGKTFRNRLLEDMEMAKEHRVGLWHDFTKELICLQREEKLTAKKAIAKKKLEDIKRIRPVGDI